MAGLSALLLPCLGRSAGTLLERAFEDEEILSSFPSKLWVLEPSQCCTVFAAEAMANHKVLMSRLSSLAAYQV